ncbi:MAG: BspA family leucine-rich repeat surface protein, partial [Lachnospiraceae bacterium]|nr:BspA family leucine-rich repeat surface protein [Lachnospiraceae bacterium]
MIKRRRERVKEHSALEPSLAKSIAEAMKLPQPDTTAVTSKTYTLTATPAKTQTKTTSASALTKIQTKAASAATPAKTQTTAASAATPVRPRTGSASGSDFSFFLDEDLKKDLDFFDSLAKTLQQDAKTETSKLTSSAAPSKTTGSATPSKASESATASKTLGSSTTPKASGSAAAPKKSAQASATPKTTRTSQNHSKENKPSANTTSREKNSKKSRGSAFPTAAVVVIFLVFGIVIGGFFLSRNRSNDEQKAMDTGTPEVLTESTETDSETATVTAFAEDNNITTEEPTEIESPTAVFIAETKDKPVLMSDPFGSELEEQTVLGNGDIKRSQIATITVLATLSDAPEDAWDVSEAQDGSVKAWVVSNGNLYDLYLAGEGGVAAPKYSNYLFAKYTNLTEITLGNAFDTGNVTRMSNMFYDCTSLTTLNLSSFHTENVTSLTGMFLGCENLVSIDL